MGIWWSIYVVHAEGLRGSGFVLPPRRCDISSDGSLSDSQKFAQRRPALRSSCGSCAARSSARWDAANCSVSLLEVRGMLCPLHNTLAVVNGTFSWKITLPPTFLIVFFFFLMCKFFLNFSWKPLRKTFVNECLTLFFIVQKCGWTILLVWIFSGFFFFNLMQHLVYFFIFHC